MDTCRVADRYYFLFFYSKDVRLVNGLTLVEGRVEVLIDGTWGTVCDENWDYNDALVVCRSLNFTGALGTTSLSEFGPSNGHMHLYDFRCNGTESNILECLRDDSESKPQCRSPPSRGWRKMLRYDDNNSNNNHNNCNYDYDNNEYSSEKNINFIYQD